MQRSGLVIAERLLHDYKLASGISGRDAYVWGAACDNAFREAGLVAHEETEISTSEVLIDLQLGGKAGTAQPTSARLWELYMAFSKSLAFGNLSLTSRQLSVLIGHLTFVWCMGRKLLAILFAVFQFIARSYVKPMPLWLAVRREFTSAKHTFFLTKSWLGIPWAPNVRVTDVSATGYGVVQKLQGPSFFQRHGSFSEAWRCKAAEGFVAPMLHALEVCDWPLLRNQLETSGFTKTVGVGLYILEITPGEIGDLDSWQKVCAFPYEHHETMRVLEARACIWVTRGTLNDHRHFKSQFLYLSGNFGTVFVLSVARAIDPSLLHQCCKLGVLPVTASVNVRWEWLLSGGNPADPASRVFENYAQWKQPVVARRLVGDASNPLPAKGRSLPLPFNQVLPHKEMSTLRLVESPLVQTLLSFPRCLLFVYASKPKRLRQIIAQRRPAIYDGWVQALERHGGTEAGLTYLGRRSVTSSTKAWYLTRAQEFRMFAQREGLLVSGGDPAVDRSVIASLRFWFFTGYDVGNATKFMAAFAFVVPRYAKDNGLRPPSSSESGPWLEALGAQQVSSSSTVGPGGSYPHCLRAALANFRYSNSGCQRLLFAAWRVVAFAPAGLGRSLGTCHGVPSIAFGAVTDDRWTPAVRRKQGRTTMPFVWAEQRQERSSPNAFHVSFARGGAKLISEGSRADSL